MAFDYDNQVKTDAARARLPLRTLLPQRGDGPAGGGDWSDFRCPFESSHASSGKKKGKKGHSSGLFQKGGGIELFKCFHASCVTQSQALDEAGYLALKMGVNRNEGWVVWLQEAGVWKEGERLAPSVMPGKRGRRATVPQEKAAGKIFTEGNKGNEGPAKKELEIGTGENGGNRVENTLAGTAMSSTAPVVEGVLQTGPNAPAGVMTATTAQSSDAPIGEGSGPGASSILKGTADTSPRPSPQSGEGEGNEEGAGGERKDTVVTVDFGGSSGGGGGGDDEGGEPPGDDLPPVGGPEEECLREFWSAIILTEKSAEELRVKRGFTRAECDFFGFKTSREQNREVILNLVTKWGEEICLLSGLLVRNERDGVVIEGSHVSAKFCGLGVKGIKVVDGKKVPEYGWNEPVLIPYWEYRAQPVAAEGTPGKIGYKAARTEVVSVLVALRPHRDNVKGQPARFYAAGSGDVERLSGEMPVYETVMVTEGEFKAGAAFCGLNPGFDAKTQRRKEEIGCAALPGIQMSKEDSEATYEMMEAFYGWLKAVGAQRVVVVFDSEDKGNPALPGYKADKRKRFDSEVWARYLAIGLCHKGYDGVVGHFPEEWRNARGKVDWDSALRDLRNKGADFDAETQRREEGKAKKDSTEGNEGNKGAETVEERDKRVRAAFLEVLRKGKRAPEIKQTHLFPGDAERIIQDLVAKLFRRPKLAHGGEREQKIARKLQRLLGAKVMEALEDTEFRGGLVEDLAKAFKSTEGGYYILKPAVANEKKRLWWELRLKESAAAAKQAVGEVRRKLNEKKWLVERVLEGRPVCFTNFVMKPLYHLRKVGTGYVSRVVQLTNQNGERVRAELDAGSFSQTSDFKDWCLKHGGYKWGEGTKELDALTDDVCFNLAHTTVNEVACFGWNKEAGLWFAGDSAIPRDGQQILLPEEDGIIWWEGEGYVMSKLDRENQKFAHGQISWHPRKVLALKPAGGFELKETTEAGETEKGRDGETETLPVRRVVGGAEELEASRDLFEELASRMKETLGGSLKGTLPKTNNTYEGFMMLGSILAFAAAPEFFDREKWFPGLFVHGERSSGKSTIVCFLMHLFGYNIEAGVKLMTSTKVGMQMSLQEYCNLPIFFEEFQTGLESWKVEVLKSMYGRDVSMKMESVAGRREIMTNAIVAGEATSKDAATRSRFVHVQISETTREQNHLEWFRAHARFFFALAGWCWCVGGSMSSTFTRRSRSGR